MNEDNILYIDNWSIVRHPINGGMILIGYVNDEHRQTSHIKAICGSLVRTCNSIYQLGKVSDDYRKFCEENNLHIPGE